MIEKKEEKEEPRMREKAREIGNVCDETPMSFTELADKLYVQATCLFIYRALVTDSNSEFANKSNSPLLRLPGELRSKIYEYIAANFKARIVVGDSNSGQYPPTYMSVFIVYSDEFRHILEVSRQLQSELWSYLVDHNTFDIDWWHLEDFVQRFESYDEYTKPYLKSSRIKSLVIDVSDMMAESIESDAEFFAKCLRPLCRDGRLQNIEIQSRRRFRGKGYEWCIRPDEILEGLRSKLDFGSVGKDVVVEACLKPTREARKFNMYRSIGSRGFARG